MAEKVPPPADVKEEQITVVVNDDKDSQEAKIEVEAEEEQTNKYEEIWLKVKDFVINGDLVLRIVVLSSVGLVLIILILCICICCIKKKNDKMRKQE